MSLDTGPADPWSTFVAAVFEVNGLIMAAGESIARPLGQTSARWQVLGRAFRPQTVAQMAAEMGHARQSVQRIADVLAHEGFVHYRPHPTDGRTQLVELTDSGRDVLTRIYESQLDWSTGVVEALGPHRLERSTAALEAVAVELASRIHPSEKEE